MQICLPQCIFLHPKPHYCYSLPPPLHKLQGHCSIRCLGLSVLLSQLSSHLQEGSASPSRDTQGTFPGCFPSTLLNSPSPSRYLCLVFCFRPNCDPSGRVPQIGERCFRLFSWVLPLGSIPCSLPRSHPGRDAAPFPSRKGLQIA